MVLGKRVGIMFVMFLKLVVECRLHDEVKLSTQTRRLKRQKHFVSKALQICWLRVFQDHRGRKMLCLLLGYLTKCLGEVSTQQHTCFFTWERLFTNPNAPRTLLSFMVGRRKVYIFHGCSVIYQGCVVTIDTEMLNILCFRAFHASDATDISGLLKVMWS